MSFDIATLTLETFLLVVVRTGCFVAIAPIFGHKSVNARKVGEGANPVAIIICFFCI